MWDKLDTIANSLVRMVCSRIFASLIAGLALGVVGYAGWSGFLWYLLAHAVVSLILQPHASMSVVCHLAVSCHSTCQVPLRHSHWLPAIQVGVLLRHKAGKDMKPFFQSQ